MEQIMWLVLGAIALVAALRARSSARAMYVVRAALIGLIAFHVGQLVFGWFMWVWAIPMIFTFILLLRAQRHTSTPPLSVLPRSTRATAGFL